MVEALRRSVTNPDLSQPIIDRTSSADLPSGRSAGGMSDEFRFLTGRMPPGRYEERLPKILRIPQRLRW